jgi:hypothetical protein
MQDNRLAFSNDVVQVVYDVCKMLFNLKTDKEIKKIFGIDNEKLTAIVRRVIDGLPENIFNGDTRLLDEVKNICAREFIFFQVQERCDDPAYQEDLSKFIHIFSRDIQRRIEMHGNRVSS